MADLFKIIKGCLLGDESNKNVSVNKTKNMLTLIDESKIDVEDVIDESKIDVEDVIDESSVHTEDVLSIDEVYFDDSELVYEEELTPMDKLNIALEGILWRLGALEEKETLGYM
jgi:hypothetical protein